MARPAGESDLAGYLWPDVEAYLPADAYSRIKEAAEESDTEGRLAAQSLDLLAGHGYPGLPIPIELGGDGGTLLECCAVQRKLASADPGLAIATNMHLFSVGVMVEHWRRKKDSSWMLLEAIATQQRFMASAFAEPNLGGSVTRSTLRARRVEGGYRVTGAKRPCSLAGVADLVSLQMQTESTDGSSEVLIALLPSHAEGLSWETSWTGMGMRGSASDTLRLDDCFIPDDLVFHRGVPGEDDPVFASGLVWFCLTTTATYIGAVHAALAAATGLLHQLRIAHLDAARAHLPSFQGMVGDAVTQLLPLEAATAALARAVDSGTEGEVLLASALALKQEALGILPHALAGLVEAVGAVGYGRAAGLERLWRDVQAIRFHPPTRTATRQFLGRTALGLPASLDLDESAPALRDLTETT
ncbi:MULTISPECIES: acyl-CoA dehydrogenase family protein [Streptomyces]|uniref:acyl-CoA dehydrogenase family protein n=1 Tax=Streptomyces TaxID=1883 RepID=UPI003678C64C